MRKAVKKKRPKEKQVKQKQQMTDNLFFFRPNDYVKTKIPVENENDRSNPSNR